MSDFHSFPCQILKYLFILGCPARTSSLAMEVCDLKSKDAFNEKRIAQILTQLNDITSGGGGTGRDVPIDDMVDIVENGKLVHFIQLF